MENVSIASLSAMLEGAMIEHSIACDVIMFGDYNEICIAGDYWKPEVWVNNTRIHLLSNLLVVVAQCLEDDSDLMD